MATRAIAVLAYDGCMGMEVLGICDTLLLANRVALAINGPGSEPVFAVSVVSLGGGNVVAAGGITIGTRRPPRSPGLLVVPGMDLSDRAACLKPLSHLGAQTAYIAKTFAKGTPVAAICVGAFMLGEAGLLDGRRATTSWMFAAQLAQRFPLARIDPAAILLEDAGVSTTGSFSAAFDLAMLLIRQTAGAKVARAVGRMGLLEAGRASQAAYVDSRMLDKPDAGFAVNVHAWLAHRMDEPYDLARMASAFHVSPRTLLRRVKAETGHSPLAYLQTARIDKAKLLLESTGLALAQVTEKVGYTDVATFGSLFKRLVGQTPAEYRRRFRQPAGKR
ncbi:GlxA family transcriptional regulator [Massilia glaciei]|nr:helix-turn-helix domain-containing protein [Massilia glaciei]